MKNLVMGVVIVAAFALLPFATSGCGCGSSTPGTNPLLASYTFTTAEDFKRGTLVNLEAPDGYVRLSEETSTFPFIWIALSNRNTVCRIDTRTGEIVGEYRTAPETAGRTNPSRTTVGLDGSVWAGNRADGSVIHIGLLEANQGIDRNGNGVIDTSTGYGDVLPWPNAGGVDTNGGVSTAEDELIIHYVKTSATATRHVSVNADNDVWVSGIFGSNDATFDLIDSETGMIVRTEGPFEAGGYGGLIDGNGVLWSADTGSQQILRWDPNAALSPTNPQYLDVPNYGLAIDPFGNIWVSNLGWDNNVRKLAPDGTVIGTYPYSQAAGTSTQGLAVDANGHVWLSDSLFGGTEVTHLLNDGTFVGNVSGVGDGSTGIAVDSQGKIWSANINDSNASRIDPAAGPIGADGVTPIGAVDLTVDLPASVGPPALPIASPYNYSDMTGAVALSSTSVQGTVTFVIDSEEDGYAWGDCTCNNEPEGATPGDSSIVMEARAADTQVGLGAETFVPVTPGTPAGLVGRYMEIRVLLLAASDGTSPTLSDLIVYAMPP
ncbi:MAG: hypothetical protein QNJ90_02680 [Planctomycetota bacterium]|nr:hypothetical protein [Planctomycetota bacterium]